MSQFMGSLAEFKASIKTMREHLAHNTHARPIHKVKLELFAMVLAVGRATLNAFIEQAGTGDDGDIQIDGKGMHPRRHTIRSLTFRSFFGHVTIRRVYYHWNGGDLCPFDGMLSLPERSYSYLFQGPSYA